MFINFLTDRHKLVDNLEPTINECYLFHGTKNGNLRGVIEKGLDVKLAREGCFGKGIYFSEDAYKAHSYTGM